MNGLWGTPLYFADALERWPAMAVSAIRAVARARDGGVVISCGRGCDRTGLLALLLLHLEQMAARDPHYGAELTQSLERHGSSVDKAIAAVVSGPVFESLTRGGLAAEDVESLRARFVTP